MARSQSSLILEDPVAAPQDGISKLASSVANVLEGL